MARSVQKRKFSLKALPARFRGFHAAARPISCPAQAVSYRASKPASHLQMPGVRGVNSLTFFNGATTIKSCKTGLNTHNQGNHKIKLNSQDRGIRSW